MKGRDFANITESVGQDEGAENPVELLHQTELASLELSSRVLLRLGLSLKRGLSRRVGVDSPFNLRVTDVGFELLRLVALSTLQLGTLESVFTLVVLCERPICRHGSPR